MRSIILPFFICLFSSFGFSQNFSLSFDGQEEYLSFANSADYNIGTGWTVEAWILADEWRNASWQGTILATDNHPTGQQNNGYAFRCGEGGILSFVTATGSTWEEAVTPPVMNLNQWHHVAATVSNETISLYVDGQLSASHNLSADAMPSANAVMHIGESFGFRGRHFSGLIDEIRIWNVSRTQAELKDNMTTDFTGSEAGLVAYFPMNEGQDNTTMDITSTRATASFNNMDASNWVGGYTLPDFDASIQNVYGVDVLNMLDRPIKLKADLQNTGTMSITDIDLTVSINGNVHHTENVSATIASGELYAYQFEIPLDLTGMVDPEITVEAFMATDGNSGNNTGLLNIKTGSAGSAVISDKTFHNIGQQTNTLKTNLPNDLHKYEKITLNLDLTCPSGGCGDWDVLADLRVVTGSGTYELARYITPYGIACGGWQVDLTDFKSVLGGEVTFLSNILVYTQKGWLVDMSIDFVDNNPEDTYNTLSRLWEKSYQVYGDPGISYDLDPVSVDFKSNTENSHVRMTISGHGQGNTGNAAEFFNVNHMLKANGTNFHQHNLWKADCAANPCSDQAGSWLFPRAGWCPGQQVEPYNIDVSSLVSAGSAELDYEFQNYTNLLNTGYNNNGHTEPHYRLYSYLVETASSPYADFKNLKAIQAIATLNGSQLETVKVSFENDGFSPVDSYTINVFHDKKLVATETFNESVAAGASVEKDITVNSSVDTSIPNRIFAEVSASNDENSGDNIVKDDLMTATAEIFAEYQFEMFPNPVSDGQVNLKYDEFWVGSLLNIYSAEGKLVETVKITSQTQLVQLPNRGMYFFSLIHSNGLTVTPGKIIYTK